MAEFNKLVGTNATALPVRTSDPQDDITRSIKGGAEQWNKFGYRDNLQASGGEETIWASATTSNNLVVMTAAETFTITYNNTTDGSGTTGARAITFYYLDSDENLAIAQHTLGSSGSDVTSFSGLGINRAVITESGTANTNTNTITVTNTTSGNDQAEIPALGGVTQQAFFFMPNNYVGATKWLELNANRSAGGAAPIIRFKGYVYNRTVDSEFEVFRYIMDTSIEEEKSFNDPCNFRLSARDVLYFVADTDRNSTEVNCRFSLNIYEVI